VTRKQESLKNEGEDEGGREGGREGGQAYLLST